jgi:hypothetical protein
MAEQSTTSVTKKRRCYEASFKLKVVEFAEKNTNRGAAKTFNVDEKRVREWRKQKSEIEKVPSKKKRLEGAGRKPLLTDVEDQLQEWIESLREKNLRVTRSSIMCKALELFQPNDSEQTFSASRGWLEKFLKRRCFTLRRRTTVSQRLPPDMIPKVAHFVIYTRKLLLRHSYPLSMIGNMDETPVWLDMPGDTTISRVGSRSVPIQTTGHEKGRFTVVLCAMADGRKLKPYIIFKGVRYIPELKQIQGVVVAMSRNGWMNEELTKDWVNRVWGKLAFQRRLLVWDMYKCHLTESVKALVNGGCKTDVSLIPGGLTKYLQPADVSWNKPFKDAYRARYDEWMANGDKSYTPGGNVRAPSKLQLVQWVKEAWNAISTDVVQKSFRVCGISVKPDGTEDGEISCIKEGGITSQAKAIIEQETSKLMTVDVDNDTDPFADLDGLSDEDEDETETNELVVDDD